MKYVLWLLKAAIFFTLFAFALNNQHVVSVHFFFGTVWQAQLVLVVLAVFSAGMALGVLVMMPRWWKSSGTKSSWPAFAPRSTVVSMRLVSRSRPIAILLCGS